MGRVGDDNRKPIAASEGHQPPNPTRRMPGLKAVAATSPWLFELHQVTHRYGQTLALSDLTVQVPIDSIGLVGQNGAGKSTLMQILLGLIRPTQGSARVLGRDVGSQGVALRGTVGYMSEREAFVPGLKGIEYVALAGQLSGMSSRQAWRRAHETLSYLGMEEARYRYLEEYSVGMKQRLKLAAAMVHDPDLLLLDEPTSGLDPEGRNAMLNVLRVLAARPNKALILSSHLLGDVERICRWTVILDQGRLLHSGPLDGLRSSRPSHYLLRWQSGRADGFLASLSARDVQVTPIAGENAARVMVPSGWTNQTFFREARNHEVVLTGLVADEDDLQSVYQRLVLK
ncbi:MAG: ABC transporter ATP-binding protein [Planctomycetaceae bacterium]|nr:MAG: ABC transporter ATP-binding protein [Planctomycetaceae bacterium]